MHSYDCVKREWHKMDNDKTYCTGTHNQTPLGYEFNLSYW